MNRRIFLKTSAFTGTSLLMVPRLQAESAVASQRIESLPQHDSVANPLPKLDPAKWIWFPSGRTLQNTFVLFRREIQIPPQFRRATGWIHADSRYRLELNGARVQWGPAPADPRWPEADPLDLTTLLKPGLNVLGATVLFYGTGDGTWPLGKPGFLFYLELEHEDGRIERVVSDESWNCQVCRAWPPGHYKRWYLRALQEQFDARLYPYGWTDSGYKTGREWVPAMVLSGSPNKPSLSAGYYEYMLDIGSGPANTQLRPRRIPLLNEQFVGAASLAETYQLQWHSPPEDYFDFRTPNAFEAKPAVNVKETASGEWRVDLNRDSATALTFVFTEQVVGWPAFTIDAPAGTVVELLVHEAHAPSGPPLLNTHFDSWTRFICREGVNHFETFDFESLRWLQLHIHEAAGPVTVRNVRVRRRIFPWPNKPQVQSDEPALQRLFDASINTLNNCAQETLVDGMARERQQYSGDGGHQLHAVHHAFGEHRLVERYLQTFSQGLTKDGFFLDCWPAYDRLARLIERQLDLTGWGPILDHGVGFNLDCWSHYLYTGDLEAVREPYPRLVRFAAYLQSFLGPNGLLPVENIGIPSVWIDHVAYQRQRHKQCAFNLYVAGSMQVALAPLCRAFGDVNQASAVEEFGQRLQQSVVNAFWSTERGLFVNNLPWLGEEKTVRTCDRSLATSVLFGQCPGGHIEAAVKSLAECPPEMGFSYPANAGWRLWALAEGGRADVIVSDFRSRWAPMTSVKENNTLQEDWEARHDSGQQWSHCAVVPLYLAFHGLMGLTPLAPGFARFQLRPQLGDLREFSLTAFTRQGPISLAAEGKKGARRITLTLPPKAQAELVVPVEERVELPSASGRAPRGQKRLLLPSGKQIDLLLEHV